jgi:hypothetical protein
MVEEDEEIPDRFEYHAQAERPLCGTCRSQEDSSELVVMGVPNYIYEIRLRGLYVGCMLASIM